MKKQIITLFTMLLFVLFLSSCEDEDLTLLEEQARIEFAEKLAADCMTSMCPEEVLCHYQNGLYHYMIFLWNGDFYDFGWIEGIEDSFYYSNEAMGFDAANEICENL